jgi:signal transduction histidine kinase
LNTSFTEPVIARLARRPYRIRSALRVVLVTMSLLVPLFLPYAVPTHWLTAIGWSAVPVSGRDANSGVLLVTGTAWLATSTGLLPGDVVLTVNDQPATRRNVEQSHRASQPGDSLRLRVDRDGHEIVLSIPVVDSLPNYASYLWYRFALSIAAWLTGVLLVGWRGERPAALVLGAAMLLVAPTMLTVEIPGHGPLVNLANSLWQLQAGAYRFFFPALLFHFLVLHTGRANLLRSRTLWTVSYVALFISLFFVTDFFRDPLAWRLDGVLRDARSGLGLACEILAAGGSILVLRRNDGTRTDSPRRLAFTALLFLVSGLLLSVAVLAPDAPPEGIEFLRAVKSLLLLLLVAMAGLYMFMGGRQWPDLWGARSRVASVTSALLTVLYGFAVAGAAAIVHSLERQIGSVEWLMFVAIFLSALLFSPVLRWAREMVDRQLFARWAELEVRAQIFVDSISAELEPARIIECVGRELPQLLDVASARLILARELAAAWRLPESIQLASRPQAALISQVARGREGEEIIVSVYRPNGDILGVLQLGRRLDGEAFDPQEYAILRTLSQGIAAALRNAESYLTLRQAQQKIDEAARVASLGAMAGGLAHEIKNPLASLKMGLHLLSEDGELGRVSRINRDVRRIDDLVKGLLRFTHEGNGEAKEVIDLRRLVQACMADIEGVAEDRGTTLIAHYPDADVFVIGGQSQLRLVVSNLLVNAVDAVAGGGVIEVKVTLRSSEIELTIEDSGPGIPAPDRERVFDLSFSTKPDGTGLGLALARRETERLGGTIEASATDRGTVLRVVLPKVAL